MAFNELQRDENGLEKCVACFPRALPHARRSAFILEGAENTAELRISGGERYAKVYNIDYNRCIFLRISAWKLAPPMPSPTGHGFEIARPILPC